MTCAYPSCTTTTLTTTPTTHTAPPPASLHHGTDLAVTGSMLVPILICAGLFAIIAGAFGALFARIERTR